ncbi:Uncharacterized protein GBIM_01689 [Gryllus bimaculatus]|nr:Uncharacterized protein GBIM_01689 [Gryllus bimaculatus]
MPFCVREGANVASRGRAEDAGEGPVVPPSDADAAAAAASPSPAPAGADAGPDAAHATPSPAAAATTTTPGASPSPDASAAADAAAAAKKLGGSLATPSPGLQRRLDSLRCTTEECPLVQPSEVVVSLRPVLTAEPVLTPIEKLRRKDTLIREALAEKQQLVADLLSVPRDDFETIADLAGEPGAHKESSELVLAAVNQVNQLTSVVNEALKVTEEEAVSAASEAVPKRLERLPSVPAHQLQSIASALNSHLTQLLKTVKTQDEERDSLRRELQRLREQVHAMHESRRRSQLEASSSASATAAAASATTPLPNHEDDTAVIVLSTGESTLAQKGDDDLDGNSSALDSHDDGTAEEFVDALSGEGDCPPEEDPPCSDPPAETPPSAEGTEDKIVDE